MGHPQVTEYGGERFGSRPTTSSGMGREDGSATPNMSLGFRSFPRRPVTAWTRYGDARFADSQAVRRHSEEYMPDEALLSAEARNRRLGHTYGLKQSSGLGWTCAVCHHSRNRHGLEVCCRCHVPRGQGRRLRLEADRVHAEDEDLRALLAEERQHALDARAEERRRTKAQIVQRQRAEGRSYAQIVEEARRAEERRLRAAACRAPDTPAPPLSDRTDVREVREFFIPRHQKAAALPPAEEKSSARQRAPAGPEPVACRTAPLPEPGKRGAVGCRPDEPSSAREAAREEAAGEADGRLRAPAAPQRQCVAQSSSSTDSGAWPTGADGSARERSSPRGTARAAAAAGGARAAVPRGSSSSAVDSRSAVHRETDVLMPFGYRTRSPIAAGAFATVVRAVHVESGHEVAVKSFSVRPKGGKPVTTAQVSSMKSELEALKILQRCQHEGISNLQNEFESRYQIHAVLDYCSGGTLSRYLAGFKKKTGSGMEETSAAALTFQVGSALAHMHSLGIAHRDVKPDNLVFSDAEHAQVKLVDFGFAACWKPDTGDRRLRTVLGTPAYMAPEIVKKQPYLGPPVDVWALGTLFFEMVHNRLAFRGDNIAQLNVRIMRGSHQAFPSSTSSRVRAAIKRMLTVDVPERPCAERVTKALSLNFGLAQDSEGRVNMP